MGDRTDDGALECSCKVGAVAAEYGLTGVHEELAAEWTDEDGPSVRALTDTFNKRVLRSAYREAGILPIDGEIDNVYRVVSGGDADQAELTRARDRLRQEGLDIDAAVESLVSHQTLYRHLRNCLDTTREQTPKSTDDRIQEWHSRIQALQNRTVDVTSQGIEQLRSHDAVDIGQFTVTTEITVSCEDCGRFYTAEEFLDARQCECSK